MRLNASIATLVLAGLSFAPATLLAKPAHQPAQKAETAAHKRTQKKTTPKAGAAKHASPKRRKKNRRIEDTTPPPTLDRVHSTSRIPKVAPAPEPSHPAEQRAEAAPRKATSEDFMRAASGLPAADEPAKPATGVSHPPDDNEESPRTPAPQPNSEPVAKTTPPSARLSNTQVSREIVAEDTIAPVIQPLLYNKRGRLIVPRPLKGSHEILVHQNLMADSEGLDRIKDDDDLDAMRDRGLLVPLPTSATLEVDDRLPANRRYSRPWTAQFLSALARAHYARFHTPLQINSAVRTVEFQQRLQRTNGNAAPAEGETASPHLTGQAVDIAKHGLSLTEIAWLRGYLLPLVQQGKIDVEEEFQQSCFHISVYKRYLPSTSTPRREIAGRGNGTAALATAIP
jgi:Family of unknown function (DUF5715)